MAHVRPRPKAHRPVLERSGTLLDPEYRCSRPPQAGEVGVGGLTSAHPLPFNERRLKPAATLISTRSQIWVLFHQISRVGPVFPVKALAYTYL